MLTTGTVTMSLADVDKMREQIKASEEAGKKKDTEIAFLKANERQVLITESEAGRSYKLDINVYALFARIREIQARQSRPSSFLVQYHDNAETELIRAVNDCVKPVYGNPGVKNVHYKNLDDVQADLRIKLEKEFEDRLGEMGSKVKACDDSIRAVKDEEMHKYEEMRKQLQFIIDEKNEYVEKLEKKIVELETGKREQTEAQRLKEDNQFLNYALSYIHDKVNEFVSKSWFKKVFGGINEEISIETLRKAFEKNKAEKNEQ